MIGEQESTAGQYIPSSYPSVGEALSQAVERPLSIVDRVEIELQKARHKVEDLEAALELLHKYPDIAQLLKYLRSL